MFRLIKQAIRSNDLITRKAPNLLKFSSANINSIGSDSAAYAGDGKTTVSVLNDSNSDVNFVNTYSNNGFRLHNNLFIYGSVILFPTHVFSWNVRRGHEINLDSLLLFDIIVPKVKIVVIGYGEAGEDHDITLPIKLKKKGISCEMLSTPNAVTTYNYLVADSVHVAGAFVPVKYDVKMTDRDHAELGSDMQNIDGKHFLKQQGWYQREPDSHEATLSKLTVEREMKKDKFDE